MHTIIDAINLAPYDGLKVSQLLDLNATQVLQVTLEKGVEFPKHISKTDATLIVLEGNIGFSISEQQHELTKHQVLQFEKNTEHSVIAFENSKFLLIK